MGPRPAEGHTDPYPTELPRRLHGIGGPLTRAPSDPNVASGRFVSREEALAFDIRGPSGVFLEATLGKSSPTLERGRGR